MDDLFLGDSLTEAFEEVGRSRNYRSTRNTASSIGTERDQNTYNEVAYTSRLSYEELDALFRTSSVIYNLVTKLPEQVIENFSGWDVKGTQDLDIEHSEAFTVWLEERGFFEALEEADILGRLHGDGYIVMGVIDGEYSDEPLGKSIKDIEYFIPKSQASMRAHGRYQINPEMYQITRYLDDKREPEVLDFDIHADRVLRFPGKKLYGETLRGARGLNDSIIQSVYQSFSDWDLSNADVRTLLSQHSLFTYGVKGLSSKSKQGHTGALVNRFASIMQGMNVMKGLPYDMDMEQVEFISRNFTGLDKLLDQLREALLSACDLPRFVLLQSTSGTAFSESGLSERLAFDQIVKRHQTKIIEPQIKRLVNICAQIKGCPIYGLKNIVPVFKSSISLSDLEQATLLEKLSKADQVYINSGVLTPVTITESRFGGDNLGLRILLRPEDLDPNKPVAPGSKTPLETPGDANT